MSVHKRDRAISEYEYIKEARIINAAIMELCLRDFGIKPHKKTIRYLKYIDGITEEQEAVIDSLIEDFNNLKPLLVEYPEWVVSHFRNELLTRSTNLLARCIDINSSFPAKEFEKKDKMRNIQLALNAVYEIEAIVTTISIQLMQDKNKNRILIERLETEIIDGLTEINIKLLDLINEQYKIIKQHDIFSEEIERKYQEVVDENNTVEYRVKRAGEPNV